MKTKRWGIAALVMSLAATVAATTTASATENQPPEIHGLFDIEWGTHLLLPWREGATATDAEDGDLTHKLTYAPVYLPSDRPGDPPNTKYVVYSVTDSAGATTTAKRYFTFFEPEDWRPDNKPPVLVRGGEDVTVCVGETYDPAEHMRFDDDYDGTNLPAAPRDGSGFSILDRFPTDIAYAYSSGPPDNVHRYPGVTPYRYVFKDLNGAETPMITVHVTARDCDNPGAPVPPGPRTPTFYLNDTWGPKANREFTFGHYRQDVLIGDWDGDGRDTVALREGNLFTISNTHDGRVSEMFTYGRVGDEIVVGDWDGDGTDTFAVRRGNQFFVKNTVSGGNADRVIHYGRDSDEVLVGDWDDDTKDTFAVRRGNAYYVKNTISTGNADRLVHYGRARDDVYVGDWNGDGKDTFAVRRGNTYFISYAIRSGNADRVLDYGRSGDLTLVGDWDGDGKDTLGVRR